jgi:hypothetical protein
MHLTVLDKKVPDFLFGNTKREVTDKELFSHGYPKVCTAPSKRQQVCSGAAVSEGRYTGEGNERTNVTCPPHHSNESARRLPT